LLLTIVYTLLFIYVFYSGEVELEVEKSKNLSEINLRCCCAKGKKASNIPKMLPVSALNCRVIKDDDMMDKLFPQEYWSILFSYKDHTLDFCIANREHPDTTPIEYIQKYISNHLVPKAEKMNPKAMDLFLRMIAMDKDSKTTSMKTAEGELFLILILKGIIKCNEHQILLVQRPLKKHTKPPEKLEECCVCLEEKKITWRCKTCKAGLMCNGCRKKTKHTCVGCPVCRSV
jgi:hypothetical protein